MGLLDTIAPTPRNKLLGLLADAAQGVSDLLPNHLATTTRQGNLLQGCLRS